MGTRTARLDGKHDLKTGASVDLLENHGEFTANPIDIVDLAQVLLRRIAFTGGSAYALQDIGSAGFVEDHWTLRSGLALDDGIRLERQGAAGSFRMAPRAGITWAPFKSGRTTFRADMGGSTTAFLWTYTLSTIFRSGR